MSEINNGGPAFPHTELTSLGNPYVDYMGMTLRDYFAAKVMQGICASGPGIRITNEIIASEAYGIADAMIKERDK